MFTRIFKRSAFCAAMLPLGALTVLYCIPCIIIAGAVWLVSGGQAADEGLLRWTRPPYLAIEALANWAGVRL